MIKKIFVVLISFFFSTLSHAQNLPKNYSELANRADSLFTKKQYNLAVTFYNNAFNSNFGQGTVRHRYNAACCWASLNVPDSAFFQLNRIASKGKYYDYYQLSNDPFFAKLKTDQRWESLIALVKKNSEETEDMLNATIPATTDPSHQ